MQTSQRLAFGVAAVALAVAAVTVWRGSRHQAVDPGVDTEHRLLRSAIQQHCARLVGTLETAAMLAEGKNPAAGAGPLADDARLSLYTANGFEPSGKIAGYTFHAWLNAYDTCAFPRVEKDSDRVEFGRRLTEVRHLEGPKLAENLRRMHEIARATAEAPLRRSWPKG